MGNHNIFICYNVTKLLSVMSRTVRVDENTYKRLAIHAGRLQREKKKPVSINEALRDLTKEDFNEISDLAGSWNITDKEYEDITASLREGWSRWKTQ
jgi:lipoate-protein ligase A